MKLGFKAKAYLWLVIILGFGGAAFYVLQAEFTGHFVFALLFFSLASFFAQIYEIEIVYKRRTSTSIAIHLAVILLGGAPLAVWTALLATLAAEILLRWEYISSNSIFKFFYAMLFNIGQILLAVMVAAGAYTLTGGHPPPYDQISDLFPAALAFIFYFLANTSLVSGIISLTTGLKFTYHLKFNLKYLHVQFLTLGVLSILIAVLYAQSPWYTFLVFIPLVMVHISLKGYMKLRSEAKGTFERMLDLLFERDPYTARHSEEVAELSEKIARKMGLPDEEVEVIRSAARIHDIGKISIPDKILFKPGSLNDEEWEVIKKHPIIGADLLQGLEIYTEAVEIVKYEHERWDGSGYPEGLKGEAIPLGARIVAVADVYSALISDRPYRKAYSKEEARKLMEEMRGTKLDPQVVDALFKAIEED